MRLYFHLENGACEIPDPVGLELDSADDVRSQSLIALEEISRETPQLFEYFKGVASEGGGPISFGSFLACAGLAPSEQSLAFDSAREMTHSDKQRAPLRGHAKCGAKFRSRNLGLSRVSAAV